MYISNIIQSEHSKSIPLLINSHLLPHRITSCAKAISALLLVLGSVPVWASDDEEIIIPSIFTPMTDAPPSPIVIGQFIPLPQPGPSVFFNEPDGTHLSQQDPNSGYNIIDTSVVNQRVTQNKSAGVSLIYYVDMISIIPENIEAIEAIEELKNLRTTWLESGRPPSNRSLGNMTLTELYKEFPLIPKEKIKALIREKANISAKEKHQEYTNVMSKWLSNKPASEATTTTTKETTSEKEPTEDGLFTELQASVSEFSKVAQAVSSAIKDIIPSETTETAAKTKVNAPKKAPVKPVKPVKPVVPKSAPIIGHNPQVGSYIANQIAAQQMFITDDLQYRQGETRYIDPVTGEEKVSSLWLNTSGAKNRFNSGNDQLRTKSNRYAIQLGGTLNKWGSGGDDQGILGMTAGFGKSTNYSHSTSSHHQAQGSVDGYNLGLYSIWYANNHTRLGPYIDLLVQYGWFNNQIKAPNAMTAANYKSYLFTSALETGYKIQLLETADTKLSLQPRVKVMWQRTSGLLHKEPNAILINVEEDNAVTTKLGMRTVFEFDIDTLSLVKNLQISPSFEAHWIHSRVNQGVQLSRAYTNPRQLQDEIELASVNVSPQGNNNIADLKLGIEANIDRNLRLWTYLGHQFGGHNYSDTQATVGMNYRF
ncbi:autotransporter outer membrane beta-barrel domain-containing protein [Yersinia enterocolitica]